MTPVFLKTLSLFQFKNYEESSFEFSRGVNCLLGENGSGKTNVLDAIHYLTFCKSNFNATDGPGIKHESDYFLLRGEFLSGESEEAIGCSVKKGQRKVFKRNNKEYDRLSEHIGLLPSVMISPYDIELVLDGSEVRRKFIDTVICQCSSNYMHDLIHYNHALLQRNNLLKQMAMSKSWHPDTLEPWDVQLVAYGSRIHYERKNFIKSFLPVFSEIYAQVSGGSEEASLTYESDLLTTKPEDLLIQNLGRDRVLERTSVGIHKDDLVLTMDSFEMKKFASQGQQKTFLIALKLAEFDFLARTSGKVPILMLDDIFDKIDERRTAFLLELFSSQNFGQVFITDTHTERIPSMLADAGIESRCFEVNNGKVELMTQPA